MVWAGPSVTCSISQRAGTGTALLTNDVRARLRKCRLAICEMATLIPAEKEQVSHPPPTLQFRSDQKSAETDGVKVEANLKIVRQCCHVNIGSCVAAVGQVHTIYATRANYRSI